MLEVHTALRPGRPTALLCVCAAALAGMLGVAWMQVREARALGEARPLAGSPLIVRPPHGWQPVQGLDMVFVAPQRAGGRTLEDQFRRSVRYIYERREGFVAPETLVDSRTWSRPAPAHIGKLPAIQVRQLSLYLGRFRMEKLLRLACTPHGHIVGVQYGPLLEPSQTDYELLDDLCDAITFSDPTIAPAGAAALAALGIGLEIEPSWRLFLEGADPPRAAHVAGGASWSVTLCPTFVLEDRSSEQLLCDLGERLWETPATDLRGAVAHWSRRDGVEAARLNAPLDAPTGIEKVAALLLRRPPHDALLLLARANPSESASIGAATRRIVDRVTFESAWRNLDVPTALAAGARLAGEAASLLLRDWRAAPPDAYYIGDSPDGVAARLRLRQPRDEFGYRGADAFAVESTGAFQVTKWALDADGAGYELVLKSGRAKPRAVDGLTIERRDSAAGPVQRVQRRGKQQPLVREFSVGAAFVSPPLLTLIEAWVARQPGGSWLIQTSQVEGEGAHYRLLRPLPPDADGRRRLWIAPDYWPLGEIVTLDPDGERATELAGDNVLRRVAPQRLGGYRAFFGHLQELASW